MYKTPTKCHACCPNCECAISFEYSLLQNDFSMVEQNKYKYFGAVEQKDNLTCRYCDTQLQRGDFVYIFFMNPGPVTR